MVIPYGPSSVSSAPIRSVGTWQRSRFPSISTAPIPGRTVERRWGGIQRHVDARVGDVAHLGERAGLDIAAVPDDAHPIAQRLHLRQDVAAQEHRPATLTLGLDALSEDLLHQGIQPDGWLVEDEELHVASQRRDQRHLLPIAFGVGGALLGRVQLEALQHLIAARAVRAATESAEEVDHLTTSELGPQVDLAGDVGEPAVERGRVGPRIAVEQPSAVRRSAAAAPAGCGWWWISRRRSVRESHEPLPERR